MNHYKEPHPIPGHEDAYATVDGLIIRSGKRLSPFKTDKGYHRVTMAGGKTFAVHRLVAMAFLGSPPSDRDEVNHIDGDKKNNRPSNLEWSDRSSNMKHAYAIGLHPGVKLSGELNGNFGRTGSLHAQSMAVEAAFPDGRRLVFGSQREAAVFGFKPHKISQCVNGRRKSHAGATWRPLPSPPSMLAAAGGKNG